MTATKKSKENNKRSPEKLSQNLESEKERIVLPRKYNGDKKELLIDYAMLSVLSSFGDKNQISSQLISFPNLTNQKIGSMVQQWQAAALNDGTKGLHVDLAGDSLAPLILRYCKFVDSDNDANAIVNADLTKQVYFRLLFALERKYKKITAEQSAELLRYIMIQIGKGNCHVVEVDMSTVEEEIADDRHREPNPQQTQLEAANLLDGGQALVNQASGDNGEEDEPTQDDSNTSRENFERTKQALGKRRPKPDADFSTAENAKIYGLLALAAGVNVVHGLFALKNVNYHMDVSSNESLVPIDWALIVGPILLSFSFAMYRTSYFEDSKKVEYKEIIELLNAYIKVLGGVAVLTNVPFLVVTALADAINKVQAAREAVLLNPDQPQGNSGDTVVTVVAILLLLELMRRVMVKRRARDAKKQE